MHSGAAGRRQVISLFHVAISAEFLPIILVIEADDDPRVLQAAIKVSYWWRFNFDTGCFEIQASHLKAVLK